MTKIGILSDIHLEHRDPNFRVSVPLCCDFVIIAGDLHPDATLRQEFLGMIEEQCPVAFIEGNHDFYYGNMEYKSKSIVLNGIRIFLTTLWTPIENSIDEFYFDNYISDARVIRNYSPYLMTEYNKRSIKEIEQSNADIVVTQHAPSYKSVHEKYRHSYLNFAFANNLDGLIEKKKNIKLWVHGHTHDPFDYTIGETRIVCNPLGYPNESNIQGFKVIEI